MTGRRGLIRRAALAVAAACFLPAAAQETATPQTPTPSPRLANAVGYEIELDALPSPHPRPAPIDRDPALAPLHVKVGIPWSSIEKTPGAYDWSVVDEIVRGHAASGYAVILHPRGDNPLHPPPEPGAPAGVDAWSAFLRALAARYKDDCDLYLLGTRESAAPPRDEAYLLKLSSVAIQSADPGARIALGILDASSGESAARLEALYAEGVAVYLDAVAVAAGPGDVLSALPDIRARMLLHDGSAAVWLAGQPAPGGEAEGGRLLRRFLLGLEQEAALTLFRVDFGDDGQPPLLPVIERIRERFPPTLAPLVESGRGIQVVTPMGEAVAVRTVRLFDPDAKKVLIAYDAGEGAARGARAVMVVDTLDLAEPTLRDVAAGESASAGGFQKDETAGLTRVAVPLADYPLVLEYRRFTTPLFGEEEKEEVTTTRLPSVEEILAAHQAFQAAQDALLQNLRADARVDYHFRIGAGSTIDVTVLNNFYLDPNVGAEFEQKEFYVNGVKWRSDRIPEFPLPQPEKVLTLPLDISLDKRYTYRLDGEETIDGYDCWKVDFEPAMPDSNLYKGRVWIDKRTHAKVQISSLQTGLEPPIISNDEKDSYRPLRGPEGIEYWVLSRIDGQQVFSTTGRNLILVREVALTGHVINDPQFESLRRQAYASEHQILRDTPAGQRYLERTPDGGRVVKDTLDPDNLFLLGGVFYNKSLDFPIPLAGINYFNRDLWGKGIQTNVFFGGVLLIANASDPDLFGSGLDASVDVFAQGFSSTDKPVVDGEEKEEENIDLISQRITAGVGLPFADFWKIKLSGQLQFQGFAKDEETDLNPDGLRFLIPDDMTVSTAEVEAEFNRSAWSVTASIAASARSDWGPWGLVDPNAPIPDEVFEDARRYLRYQGTVTKDFFLPLNQKIHATVTAFGGSDLDRFSAYRFDFFGNRMRGFSGSGLRYTNGGKGGLQYAFNLGEIIRFDAAVDHARVRDRGALAANGDGYMSFTGLGLSGQTIVGPNLIVSLDWGIALASDVDKFKGDQEILVTILRLFR